MLQPILIVIAVAAVLSFLLASRLSKRIVDPMNKLNLDEPLENEGYDELSPLLRRIYSQQQHLKEQQATLTRKQNELEAIVGHLEEGMILLDKSCKVITANQAALRLLDARASNIAGLDLLMLSRNLALAEAVQEAMDGRSATRKTELHGKTIQIQAAAVGQQDEMSGVAVVLFDITQSELDEGSSYQWQQANLFAIAAEVTGSLEHFAEEKQVRLTLEGSDTMLRGVPELLRGIVYNLTDNAIKYNHPGGSVTVTVSRQKDEAVLTVNDTGIGIPEGEQDRIFERFYRVDKSRSKEVGGTGLGLSIVKHAAFLHKAAIDVTSQLGAGTTIQVRFPIP